MPQFELVIPAFNEAKNLPEFVARTVHACKEAGLEPKDFQLVIVDNGSTDKTREVLKDLKSVKGGDYFRVVSLAKNQGYGGGLYAGLKSTTAPLVGWTHADIQCDPKDAFQAWNLAKNSPGTLVKGFRSGRNWKDKSVTQIFELCARFRLGIQVNEVNAQPKVFPRALLEKFSLPPRGFSFDLFVLFQALKNGYQIKTIPVLFPPRIHGTSKWASNFFSRYRTILQVLKDINEMKRHSA